MGRLTCIFLFTGLLLAADELTAQEGFRVYPYLQNASGEAISILWFSETGEAGQLSWWEKGTGHIRSVTSIPEEATALTYPAWEDSAYFEGAAPDPPFKHRIRLDGLDPATGYDYRVIQGTDTFGCTFRTAPEGLDTIRAIVYADCETEPESTGNYTQWMDPDSVTERSYLVDQTTGYHQNLEVIRSRNPDVVIIAGDLTQHGGEQRDWDEFWRHNTNSDGQLSLAGQIPLLAALGNHDYYEGPYMGQYNQPGSERAVHRFLTYFEASPNHSPDPEQEGRYYCLNYGAATFIVLDLCNNGANGSQEDTNFYLLGESDAGGGHAPDFGIGSTQYSWLVQKLAEAQKNSLFTFLIFHHSPYSSGPHGYPPGEGDSLDNQSGVPVRTLTPLFMEYGVDAVLSGHDEIWERSAVTGTEVMPDGESTPHTIQFYDVGVGGDGLRGPLAGTDNLNQEFLVHSDVPEIWENGILVNGGKHYGHLEIDIVQPEELTWQAILTPVYIFPVFNPGDSACSDFERREYDDRIVLTCTLPDTAVFAAATGEKPHFLRNHPNPLYSTTTISYDLPDVVRSGILITDMMGRRIKVLEDANSGGGTGQVRWDGCDETGNSVAPGIYYYSIITNSGKRYSRSLLVLRPQ